MSRFDLLPPNATPLERDFSRSVSSLRRTGAAVPVIRTAKRSDIPDSVVPWLVYEYGLGEILPYLDNDQRRAIEEGIDWQRIRGTPASVLLALGWIGVEAEVEESEGGSYRWAEYQLGLPAPVGAPQIDSIVAAAAISTPVRSRLQRIYSVYDYRRFVLDDSLLSEGSPLSDHTGTRPRLDWPQISFGDYRSSSVAADFRVTAAGLTHHSVLVIKEDRFLLDAGVLDEEWHVLNHPAGIIEIFPSSASRFESQEVWGAFSWIDVAWEGSGYLASGKISTVS